VRWLVAAARSLGVTVENLDISECVDLVFCALKSFPPRVCPIQEFYPNIFVLEEQEELSSSLSYDPKSKTPFGSVRSAEQFERLAGAGWAVDHRKKK